MTELNTFVLAVDPGKLSGIALFQYQNGVPTLLHSYETDFDTYADTIRGMIYVSVQGGADRLLVACERFTINAQTVKNSQAPYSLEQIGILKQALKDMEKHLNRVGHYLPGLAMQAPSDAKNMVPNQALKKLGYWHVGGDGHALDAIRHGLLRLVKAGWVPRALLEG
jgi:hypothetical protein